MNKYLIICLSFFLYSINSFSQSDPYTPYLDIEISVDSTNTDTSDKLIEDLFSISLSDDELNDDTSASDNISGLLNSSMDVFYRTAAYEFSPSFFKVRGLDSDNANVLINGINMNKM